MLKLKKKLNQKVLRFLSHKKNSFDKNIVIILVEIKLQVGFKLLIYLPNLNIDLMFPFNLH